MLETCTSPDRGWMGDPRRGASPGRASRNSATMAATARDDIRLIESTLQSARDGFEPGWYDTDPFTGKGVFTPNFPTPASRAAWIAGLEAKLADARQRLETAERAAGEDSPRFHLRRVRLDSGGYDSGGSYWGHGGALFEAFTADGVEFMTVRIWPAEITAAFAARGGVRIGEPGYDEFCRRHPTWSRDSEREAAKDAVREDYPNARFFR